MFIFNKDMISSVDCKNNQINFCASPEILAKLAKHGISKKAICASYIGYTGPKAYNFPTSPELGIHAYPDVTENYNLLLGDALTEVKSYFGKNKLFNTIKKYYVLYKNLRTADKWDTKFLEHFPGRDEKGHVQYAKLREKILTANQISNYFYSEFLHNLGIGKRIASLSAKIYSHGAFNMFFDKYVPNFKTLMFKDTSLDQETIRLAYDEFTKARQMVG